MDFEGTGDLAEAILTGTYDTDQLPTEAAKWVVQALQYVAGHQEAVDAFVTPEEMIGKLKTWSERTSTSLPYDSCAFRTWQSLLCNDNSG